MQTKNPVKQYTWQLEPATRTLVLFWFQKEKKEKKRSKERLKRKASSAEEYIQEDTDRGTDVPPDRSDG